jgi:hypothetical protein
MDEDQAQSEQSAPITGGETRTLARRLKWSLVAAALAVWPAVP